MKNLFALAIIVITAAACSSTQKVVTVPGPDVSSPPVSAPVVILPNGDWDYVVTGTPDGDFVGVMMITGSDASYAAKMVSQSNEIPLADFKYVPDSRKVSGTFDYSGTAVLFDAIMNGDDMVGKMSAAGMEFPFKATRKK